MDLNRIINMVLNRLMRTAVNKAVDKGIGLAAGRAKPRDGMTPEERAQDKAARDMKRRAKQAQKVGKRLL